MREYGVFDMAGSLECAVTRPWTCEEWGVLGSHAERQGYHETGTWLKCVVSSSHLQYSYPAHQTEAVSKYSFLSLLPLSHLAGSPTLLWLGGGGEFTGFFLLTMPTPPTYKCTLVSWYGPTAAVLFGPLWLPLSGPRPNTFHFPSCLSQLAQRVSDNDPPCSAHGHSPVSIHNILGISP